MIEINDIAVLDLPSVLHQETLMQGHWPLVDGAAPYCRALDSAGIRRASDVFARHVDQDAWSSLSRQTRIPLPWLNTLHGLLMHHRYKAAAVSKLPGIAGEVLRKLSDRGIRRTDALIEELATHDKRASLAENTGTLMDELERVATVVDLMRKPGIKDVKVGLYMEAGFRSLRQLGAQDPDRLREQLAVLIRERGQARAVPTPKEVRSDVAWARVYPVVIEL